MNEISAGVQILIDQLKTNPDDFFGEVDVSYDANIFSSKTTRPKFGHWRSIIEEELVRVDDPRERIKPNKRHTWFLSEAERTALCDAFTAARRQRFDAEIIATLHTTAKSHTTDNYGIAQPNVLSSSGFIAQPGQEAMRLDASGNLSVGPVSSHSWGAAK